MSELRELIDICKEILMWIKFSNMGKIKEALETVLVDDQKKIAYDLSNGDNGSAEIAKNVGVSDQTIRNWWASWNKLGIVEPLSVRGGARYKRIFDLRDLGIKFPNKITKVESL